MVFVLVLAVIAVVLIKSLMSVVSREEGATLPPWAIDDAATPVTDLTMYEPTVELRATVHDDPSWLHEAVTRLTDLHEEVRADRWSVADAPAAYVEKQLRAIVGVELVVERVEGKAKLSQNRSDDDHAGVVAGLRREGGGREHAVAEAMERLRPPP